MSSKKSDDMLSDAFVEAEMAVNSTEGTIDMRVQRIVQAADQLLKVANDESTCGTSRQVLKTRALELVTKAERLKKNEEDTMIARDAIPRIVQGVTSQDTNICKKAIGDVWKLSHADKESRARFGIEGVIPLLIMIASSSSDSGYDTATVEKATGALTSLLCHCDRNKHLFHQAGGIQSLQSLLLSTHNPTIQLHIVQALNNVCIDTPYKPEVNTKELKTFLIQTVAASASSTESEFVKACKVALVNMQDQPPTISKKK